MVDRADTTGITLTVELTREQLEAIAQRVAALLGGRSENDQPTWLDSAGAAAYMAAPLSRIHDLVALGRLHPHRDGRRLVFKRADLDAYLEAT